MAMTNLPRLEEKQYGAEDYRRCFIIADATPATMPLNGVNVDNLADTAKLATGSVLIDLQASKKHVLYGTTWHEWNG